LALTELASKYEKCVHRISIEPKLLLERESTEKKNGDRQILPNKYDIANILSKKFIKSS